MTEENTNPTIHQESPAWGPTVKLIVGLTFVGIIGTLIINFRSIIGPLLLAVIVSYLLHPIVTWLTERTRLAWRANTNLVYLLVIIIFVSLSTVAGFAVVQQTQNLVGAVQRFFTVSLPDIVEDLSTNPQAYYIGPFYVDFSEIINNVELNALLDQVVGIIQPVLGQAGGLVSTLASGTISVVGWTFFILLISYFTLAEAGRTMPSLLIGVEVPGYDADIRRLGRELGRIWNAFLRGQLILFTISVTSVWIALSVLGVRNPLAIALLAGTARFVPYIGPFITWSVAGVVAFLQPSNYLSLEEFTYALIVVIVLLIIDQIFDNLVTPRLYGQALGVHPAAVLVAAIIAAQLIGLIGLLLAAPVLATFILFGKYAFRKMLDLSPWPEPESEDEFQYPWVTFIKWIVRTVRTRFKKTNPATTEEE